MIPIVLLAAALLLVTRTRGTTVAAPPRQGTAEDRANLARDIDATDDPAVLEELARWAEYFGFADLAQYARSKGVLR